MVQYYIVHCREYRGMFGNSQHARACTVFFQWGIEDVILHCDWIGVCQRSLWLVAHVDLDSRLESGDGSRRRSAGRSGLRAGGTYCSGAGRGEGHWLSMYLLHHLHYVLRKLIRKACAVTMMVVSFNIEGAFKMYRIIDAEKSMNISALIAIYICKAWSSTKY